MEEVRKLISPPFHRKSIIVLGSLQEIDCFVNDYFSASCSGLRSENFYEDFTCSGTIVLAEKDALPGPKDHFALLDEARTARTGHSGLYVGIRISFTMRISTAVRNECGEFFLNI
jgi:hypothetical protein